MLIKISNCDKGLGEQGLRGGWPVAGAPAAARPGAVIEAAGSAAETESTEK